MKRAAIAGEDLGGAPRAACRIKATALMPDLSQRVASLESQLQKRSKQLATLNRKLLLTGNKQRRALARDLHDDLGQLLPILKIKLTALYASQDLAKIHAGLKDVEKLVDIANGSLRSLSLQLSTPTLRVPARAKRSP